MNDELLQRRLEQLTKLSDAEVAVLSETVEPVDGFVERTAAGMQKRIEARDSWSMVADLLSLGLRTGSLLIDPAQRQPPVEGDQPDDEIS